MKNNLFFKVAPLNKIIFQNAYKMKISIIFGVIHMIFGVSMSFKNYRYFNDELSVLTQFIPQMIFLVFLFFYMTFLMFIKWVKYSATASSYKNTEACAPSILITFINMVLYNYNEKPQDPTADPNKTCDRYMFTGQETLQKMLLILAVLTIPVMLFAKPYFIMKKRKQGNVSVFLIFGN